MSLLPEAFQKRGLFDHTFNESSQLSLAFWTHQISVRITDEMTFRLFEYYPRYRNDKDGIYRLQTVRYESLEVTEEMIKSETMQSKKGFSLKHEHESPSSYVLSETDEINIDADVKDEEQNEVLITIHDIDDQGNIVRSQVSGGLATNIYRNSV